MNKKEYGSSSSIILMIVIVLALAGYGVYKMNSIKKVQEQTKDTTELTTYSINNTTITNNTSEIINSTVSTTTYKTTIITTTHQTKVTVKPTQSTQKQTQTQAPVTQQPHTENTTKPVDKYAEERQMSKNNRALDTELLGYVNNLRQSLSVKTLTLDPDLCVAATIRAKELADNDYFDHKRPDGRQPQTVLSDLGLTARVFGENLAYSSGGMSPRLAFESWSKSDGHYQNMIDSDFTKSCTGKAVSAKGETYWAQLFR